MILNCLSCVLYPHASPHAPRARDALRSRCFHSVRHSSTSWPEADTTWRLSVWIAVGSLPASVLCFHRAFFQCPPPAPPAPKQKARITFINVESHNAMLRVAGSLGRSTEFFRKSLEPAAPGPPVMSSQGNT